MKRHLLLCILAVVITEGAFISLSLDDYPSRILRRYPEVVSHYVVLFPALLTAALVGIRLKWRDLTLFANAGAGIIAGLVLGMLAFTLAQLADPLEGEKLLNGARRVGVIQIFAGQLFAAGAVTLSWIHGGVAGLLAGIFELAPRRFFTGNWRRGTFQGLARIETPSS